MVKLPILDLKAPTSSQATSSNPCRSGPTISGRSRHSNEPHFRAPFSCCERCTAFFCGRKIIRDKRCQNCQNVVLFKPASCHFSSQTEQSCAMKSAAKNWSQLTWIPIYHPSHPLAPRESFAFHWHFDERPHSSAVSSARFHTQSAATYPRIHKNVTNLGQRFGDLENRDPVCLLTNYHPPSI